MIIEPHNPDDFIQLPLLVDFRDDELRASYKRIDWFNAVRVITLGLNR